jgi:hypothetical protein
MGKGEKLSQEQKDWQDQFNRHFGAKALLILSAEIMFWIMIGLILSIVFGYYPLVVIFFFIAIASAFLIKLWGPAWRWFRKVLNDENMPENPMPFDGVKIRLQKQPAMFYVLLVFRYLVVALAIYLLVKYLINRTF